LKHWRIVYPGGEGEDCYDILSDKDILDIYFAKWFAMYAGSGHVVPVDAEQRCIDDWVMLHSAIEEIEYEQ
jgi:hypothetical protein